LEKEKNELGVPLKTSPEGVEVKEKRVDGEVVGETNDEREDFDDSEDETVLLSVGLPRKEVVGL